MAVAYNRKNGKRIIGTSDTILATALISDGSYRFKDGRLVDFDYEGESDVDWNTQETIYRKGKRIFVDEDYNEVPESDVVPKRAATTRKPKKAAATT